jgi:asparagine synthase (glutamine-hydrolysing)
MCGIAGIISENIDINKIKEIDNLLYHRGPDDKGFLFLLHNNQIIKTKDILNFNNIKLTLIHRRLSIIDLTENASQPMSNEDNSFFIIFNGEIYNYLELKEKLKEKGYSFFSQSDTEVLLKCYIEYKENCLNQLIGMFSFAILDLKNNELFLARDFFGIKPLYYIHKPNLFAFSSEIKPLLTLLNKKQINKQQLYEYLANNLTDYHNQTLIKDINQLESGNFIKINFSNLNDIKIIKQKYYDFKIKELKDITFEEAKNKIRELFFKNIELHLRSDVPIGTCLSGGIDSSSIVSAIKYLYPNTELHTFSFVVDNFELSEEKYIDIVVKEKNLIGHKVRVKDEDLINDINDLIISQEIPFGSTSIYAQYRVFKLIKENNIKVVLDGQGADEILAGYDGYSYLYILELIKKNKLLEALKFAYYLSKNPNKKNMFNLALKLIKRKILFFLYPSKKNKQNIEKIIPPYLNIEYFKDISLDYLKYFTHNKIDTKDLVKTELINTLFITSLPNLLRYEDRNSMRFSIESRVPFLTPEFVEFILSLPINYIISSNGKTKYIFREALKGITPNEILERKDKIGFTPPEKRWLSKMKNTIINLINENSNLPFFNYNYIKQKYIDNLENLDNLDFTLWRIINTIKWINLFNINLD